VPRRGSPQEGPLARGYWECCGNPRCTAATPPTLLILPLLPLLLLLATLSPTPAAAHAAQLSQHRYSARREVKSVKGGFAHYLRSHEQRRREQGAHTAADSGDGASPIEFHGAGVLSGKVKVYLIYYGKWGASSAVIENFVASLSKTSTTLQVGCLPPLGCFQCCYLRWRIRSADTESTEGSTEAQSTEAHSTEAH